MVRTVEQNPLNLSECPVGSSFYLESDFLSLARLYFCLSEVCPIKSFMVKYSTISIGRNGKQKAYKSLETSSSDLV